jgi:hypothetical protein
VRGKRVALSAFVVVFGAALFAAEASAVDKPLMVRIVETEDPEGNFDLTSPGDFYATIKIGSSAAVETSHQSFPPEFGGGFIFPWVDNPTDWAATAWVDLSGGSVSVEIKVRDEDTDVPFDDPDVVDVKPGDGETLVFSVDPVSGAISGDVTATMGTPFDVSGTGDDRARITVLVAFDDADGDALIDSWETSGHQGLNLGSMGADPQRKDLFVEIDCLADDANDDGDYADAGDHVHCPSQQAVREVVQAFANAPVPNPDGSNGIQLHVDVGDRFGPGAVIQVVGTGGVVGTFGDYGGGGQLLDEAGNTVMSLRTSSSKPTIWDVKTMASNRAEVFRYGLFAHQVDYREPGGDCTSGWGELPGNDFFVSLGGLRTATTLCWASDGKGHSVGNDTQQAGTLMHELGHTLDLGHGGGDGINEKPNYFSVMNYRDLLDLVGPPGGMAQFCGVPSNTGGTVTLPGGCDFSRVAVDLTELSPGIDECAGIDGGGQLNFGPLNLGGSDAITGATCVPSSDNLVDVDVNFDTAFSALPGWNDWANLFYNFQSLGNFADAAAGSADGSQLDFRPQDLEAVQAATEAQTAPELAAVITAPDSAPNGTTVTATLEVENSGLGPAFAVEGALDDPDGVEISSTSHDQLNVGETTPGVSGTFTIPANACPTTLTFTAEATGFGLARIHQTVTAEHELDVLDVDAPTIVLSLSPTRLWPPNHTMQTIRATVAAQDRCDADPDIRLVSIASNQPEDAPGLGDGSTAPDVDGATYGTDDRSFRVRAERDGSRQRVYTVVYSATDESGNVGYASATVTVPGSQS